MLKCEKGLRAGVSDNVDNDFLFTFFSRPGQSQRLLYKHLRHLLINSVMVCENIFASPPHPNV